MKALWSLVEFLCAIACILYLLLWIFQATKALV